MILREYLPDEVARSRPVAVLEASLKSGRLAHAILIHGNRLDLVEGIALALAGALLKAPGKAQIHPDLFTLRPAKKARQIRVGDRGSDEPNTMRKLLRDIAQSSNQGGRKVAIIYEADRMNNATANAFLKTLEEPPRDTTLLLLTRHPYVLLPTIRSRCFNFKVPFAREVVANDEWSAWSEGYREWIISLFDTNNSAGDRAEAVISAYGLIVRFLDVLEGMANQAWNEEVEKLSDTVDDDERAALEVGIRKGIRDTLLAEIEESTRAAAIELSHKVPFPAGGLARVVDELENVTGLLEVNLKEDAALEYFFLRSLRIWSQWKDTA